MATQRYSVTPHPIETLLTWVKSGEIASHGLNAQRIDVHSGKRSPRAQNKPVIGRATGDCGPCANTEHIRSIGINNVILAGESALTEASISFRNSK